MRGGARLYTQREYLQQLLGAIMYANYAGELDGDHLQYYIIPPCPKEFG